MARHRYQVGLRLFEVEGKEARALPTPDKVIRADTIDDVLAAARAEIETGMGRVIRSGPTMGEGEVVAYVFPEKKPATAVPRTRQASRLPGGRKR